MSDEPAPDAPAVDPEALLDRLVDEGVVDERADGELSTTEEFESSHAVYRDTYLDLDDDAFRASVADAFELDEEEAAAGIEELGVTRAELAAYLALGSFLEDPPGPAERATMAAMVVELDPPSPVPSGQTELDDGSYEAFLADHPDAVVFVWRRDCAPCERMKDELDDLLAALPAGHAVAGIDGGTEDGFRRAYEVTAAPTTLCFRDGDVVAREDGRVTVDGFADLVERAYGD